MKDPLTQYFNISFCFMWLVDHHKHTCFSYFHVHCIGGLHNSVNGVDIRSIWDSGNLDFLVVIVFFLFPTVDVDGSKCRLFFLLFV